MEKTTKKNTNQARSILKQLYLIGGIVILMLLLSFWHFDARAKTATPATPTAPNSQSSSGPSELERLTVWNILQMNDWFLWPFIALTAYGLMINIYRMLVEHREKSRSEALLKGKIHAKNLNNLVQLVRANQPSRASRLFHQLIASFEKNSQAETLNEEINQFAAAESQSFERFNRVNAFLSEASGALGLLGTVWGIFVTFYSAKLDGPTILRGMSIALITTLTGLIISLVLNSCGTYLYTLSNRQINLIVEKASELRQALLYLQKRSISGIQAVKENRPNFRVPEPGYHPPKQGRVKESIEIAY